MKIKWSYVYSYALCFLYDFNKVYASLLLTWQDFMIQTPKRQAAYSGHLWWYEVPFSLQCHLSITRANNVNIRNHKSNRKINLIGARDAKLNDELYFEYQIVLLLIPLYNWDWCKRECPLSSLDLLTLTRETIASFLKIWWLFLSASLANTKTVTARKMIAEQFISQVIGYPMKYLSTNKNDKCENNSYIRLYICHDYNQSINW